MFDVFGSFVDREKNTGKYNASNQALDDSEMPRALFFKSDTGSVTQANIKEIISAVIERDFPDASSESPGKMVVLFLDAHGSRYAADLLEWALAKGVLLIGVVPNCTSIQQFLDVGFFGPFKRMFNTRCGGWSQTHRDSNRAGDKVLSRVQKMSLACCCYWRAAKLSTLKAGLIKCGLVPFVKDPIVATSQSKSATKKREFNEANLRNAILMKIGGWEGSVCLPNSATDDLVVGTDPGVDAEINVESSSVSVWPQLWVANILTSSARMLTGLNGIYGWAQNVVSGESAKSQLQITTTKLDAVPEVVRARFAAAQASCDSELDNRVGVLETSMSSLAAEASERIKKKREELVWYEAQEHAKVAARQAKVDTEIKELKSAHEEAKTGHARVGLLCDGLKGMSAGMKTSLDIGLTEVDKAQVQEMVEGAVAETEFAVRLARNKQVRMNRKVTDVVNFIVGVEKVLELFGPNVTASIKDTGLFDAPGRGRVGESAQDNFPKVSPYHTLDQIRIDGVVPRPSNWIKPKLSSAGQHILHHGVSFSHSHGAAESARAKQTAKEESVAHSAEFQRNKAEKLGTFCLDMELAMQGPGHADINVVKNYISATTDRRVHCGVTKLKEFVRDMSRMRYYKTEDLIRREKAFRKIKMGELVEDKNVEFMRESLALYNEAAEEVKQRNKAAQTRQQLAQSQQAETAEKARKAAERKEEKRARKAVKAANKRQAVGPSDLSTNKNKRKKKGLGISATSSTSKKRKAAGSSDSSTTRKKKKKKAPASVASSSTSLPPI
jgi:hypothetical protein